MTDKALEQAIEDAGREKVFAIAEANGWPRGSTPPKYVWWSFVRIANGDMYAG